jgi:hypothetical protein
MISSVNKKGSFGCLFLFLLVCTGVMACVEKAVLSTRHFNHAANALPQYPCASSGIYGLKGAWIVR